MKILSLQHIAIEDPGTFKDFLLADGHELTTIQLDEGPRLLCAMLDLTTEVKIGDRVTPRIERITANESMLTYKLEGS